MSHNPESRVLPAALDPDWYRSLFDLIPDAILVADHAGRYVDANHGASTLLGYSRNEFLRMHISQVSTLGTVEVTEAHRELVQAGIWVGHGALRHKDGSLVHVEGWATELIRPAATYYVAAFRSIAPDADVQ
jgi:PAS domain S-box-containing protein